jgi:hypothetical protein
MSYVVTAPLVLARTPQGKVEHKYQGAVIDWLSDEQRGHFLAENLVEESEGTEDAVPARTANKGQWVDYAVAAHGADRDEAEALTKHELVELYGG